jgi:hypothetical protein
MRSGHQLVPVSFASLRRNLFADESIVSAFPGRDAKWMIRPDRAQQPRIAAGRVGVT